MIAISVTKARENIYQILSDVNNGSQPITITNNRGKNGVLISEEDWNTIQETLYLNSLFISLVSSLSLVTRWA